MTNRNSPVTGRRANLGSLIVPALALAVSALLTPGALGEEPVEPFDGKSLDGWKVKGDPAKSKWKVGVPSMSKDNPKHLKARQVYSKDKKSQVFTGQEALVNLARDHGDSLDLYSEAKFGDCVIELELMVPKGSNSGIYVMGEYEIQVLDSYGKEKLGSGDMGAVYGAAPPPINACKAPGTWQKYEIDFRAPRFDPEGQKVANARFVKVTLNGKVLHENLELKKNTPGGVTGRESATGPIMFQGNHGAVAYRNIRVSLLE